MGFEAMSQTRRRAWLATSIWGIAGIGFLASSLAGGGPGELARDSGRHLATAGAVAFGFLAHWAFLWATRRKKGDPALADERDHQIVARANQATLVVVLVGIFALTIGLWTVYEVGGQVPVGWMWFLAYGSVILASVTSAVSILVLDGRMGGHG
jgi:uncharacterized membrane protein